jgi:elongation factor P
LYASLPLGALAAIAQHKNVAITARMCHIQAWTRHAPGPIVRRPRGCGVAENSARTDRRPPTAHVRVGPQTARRSVQELAGDGARPSGCHQGSGGADGRTSYALQPHADLVREGPNTLISTNQFKNGNHIEVEGVVFKILEFQHVKPGKGGAFVRTKLRRAADGAVIDRTFRAGEKFRPIHTEARKMQFLYADGTDAHFMDGETFEQIALAETSVEEPLKYIKPNETVDMLYIDGEPADIQLTASVELEVTHTEPGVRGDTASGGGNKPATLETGATVNVPLFVNIGDRIKVDTRSGSYMSRA